LLATKDVIYLAGMTKSTVAYTIHLTSISPKDGSTLQNVNSGYSTDEPSAISFLSHTTKQKSVSTHSLVFLEKSKIKHFTLNSDFTERKKSNELEGSYSNLISLGQQYNGHIVARKEDGTAHILRLWEDKTITNAWVFSGSDYDSYVGSSPLFSAGIDKNGKIYVSRTVWSYNLNMGSMTVFSEGSDGRGMEHGLTFPFKPTDQGDMLHVGFHYLSRSTEDIR
jgi:ER membrane protein complex subunit 1